MKTLKLIWSYLLIALKAVGKFLKFAYASQITIGAIGVFTYLFHSKLVGILLVVWMVLLTINEVHQDQK